MQALHLFQKALQCPMQGTWKSFVWGISFLILLSHWAKAQDVYEQFSDKGGYGIKKNGKKHVKAKYDYMNFDQKSNLVFIGTAKKGKKKWGILDKISGKEITPFKYDEIESITYFKAPDYIKKIISPYCKVEIDKKFGIIDQNGKEIIPVTYNNISVNFSENEKPYFIVEIEKKYGILDINNKEVIPVEYSAIRYIMYADKNVYEVVSFDKKSGVFDINMGKEIVPTKYDKISYDKETNLYIVESNDQKGIYDKNGKEIFPLQYKNITPFQYNKQNYFIVNLNGKEAVLDESKKEIIPFIYEFMSILDSRTLIAVKKNNFWGYIEFPSGKVIVPIAYLRGEGRYTPAPSVLALKDPQTYEMVYFDREGNRTNGKGKPIQVEVAKNAFLLTKGGNGLVGLQDKDGKVILKPTYSTIKRAERKVIRNIAIVSLNGKYGIINAQGKEIVPCEYDDIFIEDISDNRKWASWDMDDDKGWDKLYEKDEEENNTNNGKIKKNFFIVLLNGKYGTVHKTGKVMVTPKYDFIDSYNEKSGFTITNIGGKLNKDKAVDKRSIVDGKYGMIDKDGREIIPCKYDYLSDFYDKQLTSANIGAEFNAFKMRVQGGKWGVVDRTGKEVIPLMYDEAVSFNEVDGVIADNAAAKKNGKYGVIDRQNNVIVPFEYNYIAPEFQEGMIAVSNDNIKWGFVDRSGKLVIPMKF